MFKTYQQVHNDDSHRNEEHYKDKHCNSPWINLKKTADNFCHNFKTKIMVFF